MPEPTDQLAITLTITEWNQILQVMAKGAYEAVAPLMHKITTQAAAQMSAASAATMTGNGVTDVEQAPPPVSPAPDTSSQRRAR